VPGLPRQAADFVLFVGIRPLRIAEHHEGNSAIAQVLLVLDIFVRGKQEVEPRFFSRIQQRAVG
jgi:hypothetical protein